MAHQNREGQKQIAEEKHWSLGRSRCTAGRLCPSDIAGLLCQWTFVIFQGCNAVLPVKDQCIAGTPNSEAFRSTAEGVGQWHRWLPENSFVRQITPTKGQAKSNFSVEQRKLACPCPKKVLRLLLKTTMKVLGQLSHIGHYLHTKNLQKFSIPSNDNKNLPRSCRKR